VNSLPSALSVNEIWTTVQGSILNCPFCRKHKHAPILGDVDWPLWPVWVQACHTPSKLYNTQRGNCHIMSPNNSSHSARADEKARHKDSRRVLHRRKTNMHRSFQASTFDTHHQITTFCVLTQHSTVAWHTVPWLHIALIFCRTELCPRRYWSHSYKTMVKGKAEAQLQLHWSVTSAENTDKWSASCISCFNTGEGSTSTEQEARCAKGWSDVLDRK
jgi:hypothetical protein